MAELVRLDLDCLTAVEAEAAEDMAETVVMRIRMPEAAEADMVQMADRLKIRGESLAAEAEVIEARGGSEGEVMGKPVTERRNLGTLTLCWVPGLQAAEAALFPADKAFVF